MLKFGLILDRRSIDWLVGERVDVLLLPPGFPLSEDDVKKQSGIDAFSLNKLIEPGEICALSQKIAPFLRALLAAVEQAPIEAVASQNDLYQYHLRPQYLFLTALERFLKDKRDYQLVLDASPYRRYRSPMRPELGLMYSNEKLLAYLVGRLVAKMGGSLRTRRAKAFEAAGDALKLTGRKAFLGVFLFLKLLQKSWHARRNAGPTVAGPQAGGGRKVGIIVRTDSEVIAASYLIDKLREQGTPSIVIHDEILSSTTTLARLAELNIDSASIGSTGGVGGVLRAQLRKPAPLRLRPEPAAPGASATDAILFGDPGVRGELAARLMDFAVPQIHFGEELRTIAQRHGVACLVTFAYVDQWGAIIQRVGADLGIPTVAVQNAAQDPEEYPRLCWADHYCVESAYLKGRLVQLGYPPHRLTATGLPQFSAVKQAPVFDAGLAFAHKRILLLTQPIYQEHYERLILACARLCADAGFELAIKFHPRQAGTEYKEAIEAARGIARVAVFQAESLDDLIQSSSVVVSVVSAALIRAVNLGAPTVSFLPVEERHLDLYYAHESTVFCVPDVAAFNTLIRGALADYPGFYGQALQKRSHYLAVHSAFEPGADSAQNIVSVIEAQTAGTGAADPARAIGRVA
jgi:hypothetical protein